MVQDRDSENNRHIVLIDPVLLDITNNTQHEILRNMARQDLQDYTNKMANQMSKGRKRIKEYQIGDLVRVAVPKIDRFSVDRPTLPCKIMEKTENNKYSLGSKFGIIGVYYSASELEPLGTETFPELEVIPLNKISIREAARLQSAGLVSGVYVIVKVNAIVINVAVRRQVETVAVDVIVDVHVKINDAFVICKIY